MPKIRILLVAEIQTDSEGKALRLLDDYRGFAADGEAADSVVIWRATNADLLDAGVPPHTQANLNKNAFVQPWNPKTKGE